ncbi:MAG: MBL fold metallo-hydrolase [Desulfobacterales bacterium]|nr:MBL fold metallo-hydrolase [Desulfobacterales bacterium]
MKIHHLRNATFVIEAGAHHILIDPMLGEKGSLPPFSYLKHKARKNPVVDLPENAEEILSRVTLCLVTHSQKLGIEALTHTDHFDLAGRQFLMERDIPVVCLTRDASYMEKHGLRVAADLTFWEPRDLLGGKITAVPARHGHGWTANLMANGAGFCLALPGEPSIYISGDTVYTKETERALTELAPDIAVVAAGNAGLDVGGDILMSPDEVATFAARAPGRVVANHMEALNHCPVTRSALRETLTHLDLISKVSIPEDGETLVFNT